MSADVKVDLVDDIGWLKAFIAAQWGEPGVVSRGLLWTGEGLKAIRATQGDACVGVLSWTQATPSWQVITLDALVPGRGIGGRLLDLVVDMARRHRAERLWLVSTNDNVDALRFYLRRGWRIVAVHPDAVARSRQIKPSIPEVGNHGIPIRDEIELEAPL